MADMSPEPLPATVPSTDAIERATLAAVPPDAMEELDGWLLGFDPGTVGRAHSAVPLAHVAASPDLWREIEARYAAHGLPAVFRIPELPCFDGLRNTLSAHGYRLHQPTLVKLGDARRLSRLADPAGVDLSTTVDDEWASVFLGDGFDAVDGAHRVRLLGRAARAVHARVRVEGRVIAVGSACVAHGWVGVHGMRTALAHRGRGLASRILATFGAHALERGVERLFLQVDAANPARALYRRAGFTTAWTYAYWRRPAGAVD
jgi:N-acetylglutamate synthase